MKAVPGISRRTFVTALGGAVAAGASATAPFAQTSEPIRIGASVSLSGKYSDAAVFIRDGYKLFVDEVNAAGGIAGRKLELIVYDDASSADTGRVLAERLINLDKVTVILGPYSSPITDAVAVPCERAEVPMLASIASDAGIWERRSLKWTFQSFLSSSPDQESFLSICKAKGTKRLALVFEETPFSVTAKDWAVAEGQRLGIAVDTYGYALGNQDFRSIIERIAASGADAISQEGYLQPAIALVRQCIERGLNPDSFHFIQGGEGASQSALGQNTDGIFGRSSWEPTITTAANVSFVKSYEKAYGHVPSYHAATAYASAQVVAAALAKSTDKNALQAFFAKEKVDTIMGTYQVNERGIQIGYHYVGVQWQKGNRVIVWPDAVKQADALWPKPKWT